MVEVIKKGADLLDGQLVWADQAGGQPSPDEADCVLLLCLPVKPPKKRGAKQKNG